MDPLRISARKPLGDETVPRARPHKRADAVASPSTPSHPSAPAPRPRPPPPPAPFAMGACLSSAAGGSGPNRVVLFLGLDGGGSTTMLYQLLLGRHLQTIPTLGNNHETVTAEGMELDCWDIGGLEKMRHLWVKYSIEADGIIFVVDSTDTGRFDQAAKELAKVYARAKDGSDDELDPAGDEETAARAAVRKPAIRRHLPIEDVPLLVFANKQDLANAESAQEVGSAIRLAGLPCKYKNILPCSALELSSMEVGIRWMTDHFRQRAAGKTVPSSPVSQ